MAPVSLSPDGSLAGECKIEPGNQSDPMPGLRDDPGTREPVLRSVLEILPDVPELRGDVLNVVCILPDQPANPVTAPQVQTGRPEQTDNTGICPHGFKKG